MEFKRGIPVSPGVAIGTAMVLDTDGGRVAPRHIDVHQIDAEIKRLKSAMAEAAREARVSQRTVADNLGRQVADILGAHASLLEAPGVLREAESRVRDELCAAEYAFSLVMGRFVQALASLGPDHRFATRSADLFDIERRVLDKLCGQRREQILHGEGPVIVLAHDLTPSQTAELDPKKVVAFATEAGGRASHTAIMAGALEIPAVVGVGEFLAEITDGVRVIVDGHHGVLIIDPDLDTLRRYESARTEFQHLEESWERLRDLPALTKDGVRIQLYGNIEFPHETEHCRERGAEGVGLYRTEFLYLGRDADPTEEEHLEAYKRILKDLGPSRPVVIRTLDLGADKFSLPSWNIAPERNPFLGVRSIRLCLRNLGLFKTQLRAILKASAFGDVRIMFPMISTVYELRQCKLILAEVREDLEDEGVVIDRKLPIGTMIEVPSAAIVADLLAREADFFSIGTNDLVQYALAADRTNEAMADLYCPADPAVLRLIKMVVNAASVRDIPVNLCGEMSGDPLFTLLLIGMGLRQLSVAPHNIPEIKTIVRSVGMAEATRVADEALRLESARDVTNFLREHTRRLLPEVVG